MSEIGSDEPADEPPSPGAEQLAPRLRGDEAELYRAFNPKFVRTLQSRVQGPREVVNDACAVAWLQFMRLQPDRDRHWQAWFLTTAEREAWRLNREEARNLHSELTGCDELGFESADPRGRVELRACLRHALDLLSAVPDRRRRAKGVARDGLQVPRDLRGAWHQPHAREPVDR